MGIGGMKTKVKINKNSLSCNCILGNVAQSFILLNKKLFYSSILFLLIFVIQCFYTLRS